MLERAATAAVGCGGRTCASASRSARPPPARQKAPAKAAAAKPARQQCPNRPPNPPPHLPTPRPAAAAMTALAAATTAATPAQAAAHCSPPARPSDTASIGDPAALVSDATEGAADPAQAHTSAAAQPPRSATQTPLPPPPAQHPCREDTALPPAPTRHPTLLARATSQAAPKAPGAAAGSRRCAGDHPPGATSSLASSTPPPCACPNPRGWRLMWSGRSKIQLQRQCRAAVAARWPALPSPPGAQSAVSGWPHPDQHRRHHPGACCPSALATARAAKAAHFDYERGRVTFSANNPGRRWWRARKTA